MDKIRLNLDLPSALHSQVDEIATDSGTSMTEVVRMALALYRECWLARKSGQHIGIVQDPAKLDREFVGTTSWRFT